MVDPALRDFIETALNGLDLPPHFEITVSEHPGGSIYIYAGFEVIRISDHDQPEGRDYGDAPIADIRVKYGLDITTQRQIKKAVRCALKKWTEIT